MSTEQLTMSMFASRADYDAAARAQGEQLPDGLGLAVMLIGVARDGVIFPSGQDRCGQAIDAIRAEHAQRITLQHHAADQAQRIAELEAERDALRARLAEIEASPVPAIPDGWRLVPERLTMEMRRAWDAAPDDEDDDVSMRNAYHAMIAAAPEAAR